MDPAKTAAGGMMPPQKPKFLVLDAGTLDDKDDVNALKDYIKLDRIEFVFPEGLSKVPLIEECRALCDLENFDIMYDLIMQYLAGKTIAINIIDDNRNKIHLGSMHVTDKETDLRFMQCVADYPCLVNWLCEFMAGHLSKKFPLPPQPPASSAAKKQKKAGKHLSSL